MTEELSALRVVLAAIAVLFTAVFARLIHVLPGSFHNLPLPSPRTTPSHICIVLGSGGHTAEMISLIRDLDPRRQIRRSYVVSAGDSLSSLKAVELEQIFTQTHNLNLMALDENVEVSHAVRDGGTFEIFTVPRARRIHQPLWSAPFSSMNCLWCCIKLLARNIDLPSTDGGTPDVVITNGPATGVIIVLAVLILKFFGFRGHGDMKTVYIESWARVKTLSLSGKILRMGLTDRFLVQWDGLKGGRAEYLGVLVQ